VERTKEQTYALRPLKRDILKTHIVEFDSGSPNGTRFPLQFNLKKTVDSASEKAWMFKPEKLEKCPKFKSLL
jgi:hypothetical protein